MAGLMVVKCVRYSITNQYIERTTINTRTNDDPVHLHTHGSSVLNELIQITSGYVNA